jgi:hypothetical protein
MFLTTTLGFTCDLLPESGKPSLSLMRLGLVINHDLKAFENPRMNDNQFIELARNVG